MSHSKPSLFVELSFNLPMDSVWTYSVPLELQEKITVGGKVKASFLNNEKLGVITRIHDDTPSFNTKKIDSVVMDDIPLPSYAFTLQKQIAEYYGCSFNEALHLFVFDAPLPQKRKTKEREEKISSSVSLVSQTPLSLNKEQGAILESIWTSSKKGGIFHPSLIHGVTGSGKTEVYMALIQRILENSPSKQALLLIPEIAITTQLFERISRSFNKENIALIHSHMTPKQKREALKSISKGEVRLVMGPRSALFSPFKDLGLIIMDEEQDFSYKSQNTPRYHARRVSLMLAKHLKIPFVMGSATPSLETYFAATKKQIQLYKLTKRFWETPLPSIKLVDMREQKTIFSEELLKKLVEVKKRGKQSILFLNRRGYSPFLTCHDCNYTFTCTACSISLSYHKKLKTLSCHYCGKDYDLPKKCPECGGKNIKSKGTGTERLEEEIKELFHGYKVLRMDRDTMKARKKSYEEVLESFSRKEADILIGTQMVSKGLDFPHVELVGVISCDLLLHIPDFRAGEYIFTLITQIAGRSGRKTFGEALLQTRFPEHYAIQFSLAHDYEGFFQKEIESRQKYHYPPFSKWIRLVTRSKDKDLAEKKMEEIYEEIKKIFPNSDILGPSSCIIEKISHQYRYHLLLKVKDPLPYIKEIKPLVKKHNQKGDYYIECDVDPLSML